MATCWWRPTAGLFHQLSRRGGVGGWSCRPDPTLSPYGHAAPPAGQTTLQPQQPSEDTWSEGQCTASRVECTIRVVGVSVGARSVPALNGAIHPPTEALLTAGAHGNAEHSSTTREGRRGLKQKSEASLHLFRTKQTSPVSSECVDGFHVESRTPAGGLEKAGSDQHQAEEHDVNTEETLTSLQAPSFGGSTV